MQLTLDWGNILVMVLAGVIAFVWNTLQSQIRTSLHSLKTEFDADIRSLSDRAQRNDTALLAIPAQFKEVVDQLRRIELQLSSNHPTKEELKDLEASVARLSEHMGRAAGAEEDRNAQPYKRSPRRK